jgi:hypothetical protein
MPERGLTHVHRIKLRVRSLAQTFLATHASVVECHLSKVHPVLLLQCLLVFFLFQEILLAEFLLESQHVLTRTAFCLLKTNAEIRLDLAGVLLLRLFVRQD